MKQNRLFSLLVFATLGLVLCGCVPTAVAPFYLQGDTFFEPNLLGTWTIAKRIRTGPSYLYTFEAEGGGAYRLTKSMEEPRYMPMPAPLAPVEMPPLEPSVSRVHIFRLGNHTFLDVASQPGYGLLELAPKAPTHMLLHVLSMEPTLRVRHFHPQWLAEHLQKNPEALRHMLIQEGDDPRGWRLLLTADTKELQSFALKHLDTGEAWVDVTELERIGAPGSK